MPAGPADEIGVTVAAGDGDVPLRPRPHPLGLGDPPSGPPGRTNDLVVSRTDPDTALVGRENVPVALYHKVHVGVDGGTARIITAIDMTPGDGADETLLDRMRKEHEGATGRMVAEVTADATYGTFEIYRMLEAAGIRASIPPHRASDQRRAVPREQFVYDPATDRFTCPRGRLLTRQGSSHTANIAGSIIYRAAPKACGACPLNEACCGTAQARTLSRPADGGVSDRARTYLRTPHAKRNLRQRMSWAETPMAELKERHGTRRAQRRGRGNVLIQALGAASAYNIKKLVRWHRRRPQVALACHPPVFDRCDARSPEFMPRLMAWRHAHPSVCRAMRRIVCPPSHRCNRERCRLHRRRPTLLTEFGNRPVGSM